MLWVAAVAALESHAVREIKYYGFPLQRATTEALRYLGPVLQRLDTSCVIDAHFILNESAPTTLPGGGSSIAPTLCRIASAGAQPRDGATALLSAVDSLTFLRKHGPRLSFSNQLSYAIRTRRRFYLWLGSPAELDIGQAQHVPWQPCGEPMPLAKAIYHARALAALALFTRASPRVDAVFYIDADAWFTSTAFAHAESGGATLESYANFAPAASLFATGNHYSRPVVFLNSGLLLWRNTEWSRRTLALWWRTRCSWADQLALWAVLFASWRAETSDRFRFDPAMLATYKRGGLPYALTHLRRQLDAFAEWREASGAMDNSPTAYAASGYLQKPLELPNVVLLPCADIVTPNGTLPAFRSNAHRRGTTFFCHTKASSKMPEPDGKCRFAQVCDLGKCEVAANARTADDDSRATSAPDVVASATALSSARNMTVFSACTDGCSSEAARRFVAMAAHYRLRFVPIGSSDTWRGFDWMARQYADAAAALPPTALAIFADHSDMFIQADAAAIAGAFEHAAEGKPLVLSLETGCPNGRCTVGVNVSASRPLGESGIPSLRFVNGGIVIGYAWALRRLWDHAANNSCCRVVHHKRIPSAQRGIGDFVRSHRELVAFDRAQRLCSVIVNLRTGNEWAQHYGALPPGQPGTLPRIRNRHSGVAPCFVHMPGVSHEHLCADKKAVSQMLAPYDEVTQLLVPLPNLTTMCQVHASRRSYRSQLEAYQWADLGPALHRRRRFFGGIAGRSHACCRGADALAEFDAETDTQCLQQCWLAGACAFASTSGGWAPPQRRHCTHCAACAEDSVPSQRALVHRSWRRLNVSLGVTAPWAALRNVSRHHRAQHRSPHHGGVHQHARSAGRLRGLNHERRRRR